MTESPAFEFDADGICFFEAQELGDVYLTQETWRRHSVDHEGGDRTYFEEFAENRQAIIDTLRAPEVITQNVGEWNKNTYKFQARHTLKMRMGPDVCTATTWLLVVIVGENRQIISFFPMKKPPRGKVIYVRPVEDQ